MNAIEIEAAATDLAIDPFEAAEFLLQLHATFGNKEVALSMSSLLKIDYDMQML